MVHPIIGSQITAAAGSRPGAVYMFRFGGLWQHMKSNVRLPPPFVVAAHDAISRGDGRHTVHHQLIITTTLHQNLNDTYQLQP